MNQAILRKRIINIYSSMRIVGPLKIGKNGVTGGELSIKEISKSRSKSLPHISSRSQYYVMKLLIKKMKEQYKSLLL